MFRTIANSFCLTRTLEKLTFLSSSFYGTRPVILSLHAWPVYSFMFPYECYAMIFKFLFHFSSIKPLWIYRSLNVFQEHRTLKQRFMYFTPRGHPKNNVTIISLTVQRISDQQNVNYVRKPTIVLNQILFNKTKRFQVSNSEEFIKPFR